MQVNVSLRKGRNFLYHANIFFLTFSSILINYNILKHRIEKCTTWPSCKNSNPQEMFKKYIKMCDEAVMRKQQPPKHNYVVVLGGVREYRYFF